MTAPSLQSEFKTLWESIPHKQIPGPIYGAGNSAFPNVKARNFQEFRRKVRKGT